MRFHRLIALLSMLVVAGCGSDERLAYQSDLRTVAVVVERALADMPSGDAAQVGPGEVEQLADDLRAAADQLAGLDPPDDARRAQDRLGQGLRDIATAYDDLARKLRGAGSDAEQGEVYVTFATDERIDAVFEDVVAAQEAYADAGYRVFEPTTTQP